jgi:hypothetical protein
LVTAWIAFVPVRVEVFNQRMPVGWRMPCVGGGEWRSNPFIDEASWRKLKLSSSGDPMWETRALTPSEAAAMRAEVADAKANDACRDWVASAGLLQYILAPVVFFVGLYWLATKSKPERWVGLIMIVVATGALWHALSRAYLSSLM